MFGFPFTLVSSSTQAAASVGIIATLITFLIAVRKKIPHPTEFWIIGVWFRLLKIHNHEKFDLVVDLHDAKNVPNSATLYVHMKAGRHEVESTRESSRKAGNTCDFFQRVPIHVRQMDDTLEIRLYRKTPLSSELVGEAELSVLTDIIQPDFPRDKTINLRRKNQNTSRLRISLYRVEAVPNIFEGTALAKSNIVQQAMIQNQINGKPVSATTLVNMTPKNRLVFLAKMLEGPLQRMSSSGAWRQVYAQARLSKSGLWLWCMWPSEKERDAKKAPAAAISFLAMTAVLTNDFDHDRHTFFIRYVTRRGAKQLYLRRVDRDRDLWVDGLYKIIEMVRDEYNGTQRRSLGQSSTGSAPVPPNRKRRLSLYNPDVHHDNDDDDERAVSTPTLPERHSLAAIADMTKWLQDTSSGTPSAEAFTLTDSAEIARHMELEVEYQRQLEKKKLARNDETDPLMSQSVEALDATMDAP